VTARLIVLRSASPPSSPAPSAHRCAAAGLWPRRRARALGI